MTSLHSDECDAAFEKLKAAQEKTRKEYLDAKVSFWLTKCDYCLRFGTEEDDR